MDNEKLNQVQLKDDGFPTDEQIAAWKKKHGKVHAFTDAEDNIIVIIREAQLKDIERANSSDPTSKKPFNFNRSILKNCNLWVKDGVSLEDGVNDSLLMGLFEQLSAIVKPVEIRVKEL